MDGQFFEREGVQFEGGPSGIVSTLSLVAQGQGQAAAKLIPSTGVVAGDLAVIFDTASNGSGDPPAASPAGWTTFCDVVALTTRLCFHAKILTAADIGSSPTGLSGTFRSRYVVGVFHPNVPITSFSVNSPQQVMAGGDPAALVTTAGSASRFPVLVLANIYAAAAPTQTISPAMTDLTTSSANHVAKYTIYNAGGSPANQSIDINDTGLFNGMGTAYLLVN